MRVSELRQMWESLPAVAFRTHRSDATFFARRSAAWFPRAFARLLPPALITAATGVAFGLIVLMLAYRGVPEPEDLFVRFPPLAQIAAAVLICGVLTAKSAFALSLMRVSDHVRHEGTLTHGWRAKATFDRALETTGIVPTLVTSFFLSVFGLGILVGGAIAGQALAPLAGLAETAGMLIGLGAALAVLWAGLFFPLQWVIPLMAEHDCGWLNAMDASVHLVMIAPRRSMQTALWATLFMVTGLGIPGALYLWGVQRDEFGPLVPLLLQEKTARAVREELRDLEDLQALPKSLRQGEGYLKAGRYLDAVNAFQIYLRDHPAHPDALSGLCRSLLALGNTIIAREKLEYWERQEPDDPEPGRLLKELRAGKWDEGGERWKEAQARSTQKIGKGLTQAEAQSDAALRDLREGRREH